MWLRYSRERALKSSKIRALGNLNLNFKISNLFFAAQLQLWQGCSSGQISWGGWNFPCWMPVAGRARTSGAPDVASNAPLKISFPDVKQLGRAYRLGFYAHVLLWKLQKHHLNLFTTLDLKKCNITSHSILNTICQCWNRNIWADTRQHENTRP